MLNKRFTRREFLSLNIKMLCLWLILPILKLFRKDREENISHKEASFYKKLAG